MVQKFGFNENHQVVEVGNDGYLLQFFQKKEFQFEGGEPAEQPRLL